MTTEYAGSATYHDTVTRASDGDLRNATILGAGTEDLADRTAWLRNELMSRSRAVALPKLAYSSGAFDNQGNLVLFEYAASNDQTIHIVDQLGQTLKTIDTTNYSSFSTTPQRVLFQPTFQQYASLVQYNHPVDGQSAALIQTNAVSPSFSLAHHQTLAALGASSSITFGGAIYAGGPNRSCVYIVHDITNGKVAFFRYSDSSPFYQFSGWSGSGWGATASRCLATDGAGRVVHVLVTSGGEIKAFGANGYGVAAFLTTMPALTGVDASQHVRAFYDPKSALFVVMVTATVSSVRRIYFTTSANLTTWSAWRRLNLAIDSAVNAFSVAFSSAIGAWFVVAKTLDPYQSITPYSHYRVITSRDQGVTWSVSPVPVWGASSTANRTISPQVGLGATLPEEFNFGLLVTAEHPVPAPTLTTTVI